jgi:hypothetical protein
VVAGHIDLPYYVLISIIECVILGSLREVDENCALLGYNAASSGNFSPTFRDNLAVHYLRVKP